MEPAAAVGAQDCVLQDAPGQGLSSASRMTKEQLIENAVFRASVLEVILQGDKDLLGNRQLPSLARLGRGHLHATVLPIDISKPQSDYFRGPKSQVQHAHSHGG